LTASGGCGGRRGFWQRYTGVFAGDGRTIKGAWEGSADGSRWKHDFDLNYPRPGVTGLRPEAGTAGDRAAAKG